jgi:hypothetical protein
MQPGARRTFNQEDRQVEFCEDYYRVAEEHDKESLRNRKENSDTLLIIASRPGSLDEHMLIRAIGWSIFRRRHRIYHPSRVSTPARPER